MLKLVIKENKGLLLQVVIVYGVLLVLTLLFARPASPLVVGLTFGALVALLNFFEMALTFKRAVFMPSHKAQQFAVVKYLFRYALTAGVLLVSFLSPKINPFGTIFGLLIIKGVLYATHLTKNKGMHQRVK